MNFKNKMDSDVIVLDNSVRTLEDIIAEVFELEVTDVTNELEYRSIMEWDSLGHVNLLLALEEEFNIEIDINSREELTTVGRIKAYLHNQLGTTVEIHLGDQNESSQTTQTNLDVQEKVHRGLAGVIFDHTKISKIDGKKGNLLYRGISIHDLVEYSSFEETAYLLFNGSLPTEEQLQSFSTQIKQQTELPESVLSIIYTLKDSHPMTVLRTAVSSLGYFNQVKGDDNTAIDQDQVYLDFTTLLAQVPMIVAAQEAYRNNRKPLSPHPNLSYAANLLYMMRGVEPKQEEADIIDKILILHADHGSNASAFAARVAAGTQVDVYGALTAALSTFAGDLHGGAIEKVMYMIKEIEDPEKAKEYVEFNHKAGKPVMGFGHRVYQTEDPRAKYLRETAQKISESTDDNSYRILDSLVYEMEPYIKKGVNVNVDFYASVIYYALKIPIDYFISIFSIGRMAGWMSQIREQYENNILIRPLLNYVGEEDTRYIPIKQR